MKIVAQTLPKTLKLSFTAIVLAIFTGLFFFSCKNNKTKPLFTTFSLPEHELITSLDTLNKDTLLVGTDLGNLYYYRPKTSAYPVDTLKVGYNRPVYCASFSDFGLFVGVSNAGLKLFLKEKTIQYWHPQKGKEYAVYKVLKCGDTLFCATSSGLAWVDLDNLKDTLLKPIYPDTGVIAKLPDCKVERLTLEGDSLRVFFNDSILSFNINENFKGTIKKGKKINHNAWKDTITIGKVTYKFRQYDTKFYAYDNASQITNPHNFILVTNQENKKGKHVIAIADDDGLSKDVYVGDPDGRVKWDKAWTRCLQGVPGQITDFIVFPNDSCLILTSDEIAYKGNKHGVQRMVFHSKPENQPNRVKSIYYSTNFKKLYIALGAGYVNYDLDSCSNNPIWNSEKFEDTQKDSTGSVDAFRCFAEWKDTICFGTIDDGILRADKKGVWLKPLLEYKDVRNFKNYTKHHENDFYILTGDSIYKIGDNGEHSKGANAHIQRLYDATDDGVFGVSSGHLYLFSTLNDSVSEMVCFELDPTIGYVNPYAILDKSNYSLYIGTDHGLFYSNEGDLDNLKTVVVDDPIWKTHNLWPFALAGIVIIALLFGYLLYRTMKQHHSEELKEKTEENKRLNNSLRTTILDQYQNLNATTLPDDKESKDWVIRTASFFKENYAKIDERIKKTKFENKDQVKKTHASIDNDMLKYAFAVELYTTRCELKKKSLKDLKDVKDIFNKVQYLTNNYLTKIISYKAGRNHKNKEDVLLHFLTIALLSEDEKTNKLVNLINNDDFLYTYIPLTEYGKLPQPKGKSHASPKALRNIIRKDITEDHELFQPKEEISPELFKEIIEVLKEENRIEEYEGYSEPQTKKKELIGLKNNLREYATEMPEKAIWEEIIEKIAILRGEKSKKKGFVFNEKINVDNQNLPNIKLLKEGIRLDLKDSDLAVLDFENSLKELFIKVTCKNIRNRIGELRVFVENKNNNLSNNESFYKQVNDFFANFKQMFEKQPEAKKHDLEGALLLWTWGLLANKQYNNKDFLQTFFQNMQNQGLEEGNIDENTLERWGTFLANYAEPLSIIKPKKQFVALLEEKEWKDARHTVLNLLGISELMP